MQKENFIFNNPVVLVSGNSVKKYYTSAYATLQDNFDPYRVLRVCSRAQKKHKGQEFRFASKVDILAYEILQELKKEVKKSAVYNFKRENSLSFL